MDPVFIVFILVFSFVDPEPHGLTAGKTMIRHLIVLLAAEDAQRSRVEGAHRRNTLFTYAHKQDDTKTNT